MFRATTSIVSALSGCVAKGCQLNAPVFPSPSKIPYGGFSPVRLQTERCMPRPSHLHAYTRPPPMSRVPMAHLRARACRRNAHTRPSRPEALGSPAGYAVPPDRRLLWPHLRLSSPQTRLSVSSDSLTPGPSTRGMRGSPFYSACLSLRAASRTPTPWLTAFNRFFVTNSGLHHFRSGSAVVYYALRDQHSRVTRQQNSLNDTAHRVARRSPATTCTIKLSPRKSPFHDVDYNYAGIRSIPATGLSPARHAAFMGCERNTRKEREIIAFFCRSQNQIA